MLTITIPESEEYDSAKNLFIYHKARTITMEHSLVSISKWESKWCKPFLSKNDKTAEEVIDYLRCMTLTQNVEPEVYTRLTPDLIKQINDYMDAPMTATWFSDENNKKPSKEVITAEIIYYWMITLNIPFECQKWHLNRLLTLIRVCSIKNQPPKKMSKRDVMNRNRALNNARRKAMNTRG